MRLFGEITKKWHWKAENRVALNCKSTGKT